MPEKSRAKIRSRSWSWMPTVAGIALILPLALLSTSVRADDAAGNFKESCAGCHGETGKGDGPKAAKLSVKVGDLTDCAKMSKVTDDVLFKAIKEGGPAVNLNKAMQGFGDAYEDPDIKALVAYVRGFCGK